MNKGTIIALLAVVAVFVEPHVKNMDFGHLLNLGGTAVEKAEKPSGKFLSAVEPVQRILANADSKDKANLSDLWYQMADLIALDDSIIANTGDIVRGNVVAGKLMHLEASGKYSGLGAAASNAVKSVIGDDVKALDSATRSDAVAVFRALSWAAAN